MSVSLHAKTRGRQAYQRDCHSLFVQACDLAVLAFDFQLRRLKQAGDVLLESIVDNR